MPSKEEVLGQGFNRAGKHILVLNGPYILNLAVFIGLAVAHGKHSCLTGCKGLSLIKCDGVEVCKLSEAAGFSSGQVVMTDEDVKAGSEVHEAL